MLAQLENTPSLLQRLQRFNVKCEPFAFAHSRGVGLQQSGNQIKGKAAARYLISTLTILPSNC